LKKAILRNLDSHAGVLALLREDESLLSTLEQMAKISSKTLRNGGKMLLCGNGGSAADAQHIAAELSGRYLLDREPLFVEALHVNTSYLTAVGNDYGFSEVYRRAVKAQGRPNDVLLALSTSGRSENVLLAIDEAKKCNMTVFGFTGKTGGNMPELCDLCLIIPSHETPRIQEFHLLLGHILCELIETELFA